MTTIDQELGDTLQILVQAIKSEDILVIPKCLRKLDQNRVTVATWTFDDVATVLNFPEGIFEPKDDATPMFASGLLKGPIRVDKINEFQSTGMADVLRYLSGIARGLYAPGGREHHALYWDGWDKDASETVAQAVQESGTGDLTETIKLYELLQRDPLALNRWIGFGLGLTERIPAADPPNEAD